MMKIAKRFSALFCVMMLVLCASIPAFAESVYKLNDEADLFTSTEDSEIEQRLEDASSETGWDIVIYTNYNGVDDIESFCDDYYEDNGFGLGYEYSGVMLTVDMSSRKLNILTKGDAQLYFDDERTDYIFEEVQYNLTNGNYYDAADVFITKTSDYHYEGVPENGSYEYIEYDNDYEHENLSIGESFLCVLKEYGIIIAVVAIAVGVLSVVFTSHRYKNHGKEGTYDLRSNSSTNLYEKQDVFLHKSVSVTTVSSSSSSSGGGRSSGGGGGSSHGGRSGSF